MHPIHNIYVVQNQWWCIDKAHYERKMSHGHWLFYFQHAVSGTDGVNLRSEYTYSRITMTRGELCLCQNTNRNIFLTNPHCESTVICTAICCNSLQILYWGSVLLFRRKIIQPMLKSGNELVNQYHEISTTMKHYIPLNTRNTLAGVMSILSLKKVNYWQIWYKKVDICR